MKTEAEIRQTFDDYVAGVTAGTIVAGKLVKLAVARHLKDVETAAARGLVFDFTAGARACQFFSLLQHSKGKHAGQVFELSPFQVYIVASVWGWKHAATGLRRYRTVYVELARKQGKTCRAAALALLLLVADGEEGAEIYCAATKRDQARLAFDECTRMVKRSKSLKRHIQQRALSLQHEPSNSKLVPLGRDQDSLDGLNAHGLIIDELHAHKNRELLEVLDSSTGARQQPLCIQITTAGAKRTGIGWEQHTYAEKVVTGVIEDDSLFAFIAALDDDDDLFNEAAWPKANPNLGVSCELEQLRIAARKAKEQPTARAAFARYHAGRWSTDDVRRWIDFPKWAACKAEIKPSELTGRVCYGGLDLAGTRDLSSLVLLFPEGTGCKLLCYCWAPRDRAEERARADRVPYLTWASQGHLKLTDKLTTDQDEVFADIAKLKEQFDIRIIAFDRFNAAMLANRITDLNITASPLPMTFLGLSLPTRDLEGLIYSKALQHDGNPLLGWAVSNVVCVTDDAGNIRPSKGKSIERIDPVIATVCAVAAWKYGGDAKEDEGSVYDHRGIEWI